MEEVKKTSIESTKSLEGVKKEQFFMPTLGIIVVLLVAFFVLKMFIYIKDSKRHGR